LYTEGKKEMLREERRRRGKLLKGWKDVTLSARQTNKTGKNSVPRDREKI